MRYLALATDYDGTIATAGRVDEPTLDALKRLRAAARKLILVTGRELPELKEVFPEYEIFDRIVAENGALLHRPATREELVLGEEPPEKFVRRLRERNVSPLSVGRSIVATWDSQEQAVLETIHELGLELQVIFNKGAVMVLPSGVNKATGLRAALKELGLSVHNTVGVGDAENDHAFLSVCECGVAVSNALETLKERADLVTDGDHGAGVTELIDRIIADDLRGVTSRHRILMGYDESGEKITLPPHGTTVLLAGPSGSGKSTLVTAVIERLCECGYQFCIVDPEGDYQTYEGAVVLGDPARVPTAAEVCSVLEKSDQSVVLSMLGIALEHRPAFFAELLPKFQALRARTGRPHWVVIDEAHHMLPANLDLTVPQSLETVLMVTVHPEEISPVVLSAVDTVILVGKGPAQTAAGFSKTMGRRPPDLPPGDLDSGQMILWRVGRSDSPVRFRLDPPKSERRRHSRKYAEGELPPDRSFFFRGPEGKLNLRAQNLLVFLQMAEGVDDDTWLYHLRNGDYVSWFRDKIKDPDLAALAEKIDADTPAAESRRKVKELIEERYTAAVKQS
jgi:HAD superfamily hydrolase (TIGR01484 family)